MADKSYYEDIICARATPPGGSAIAVIRVSGAHSHKLLAALFKKRSGAGNEFRSHRVYYGSIVDGETIIDDVVVLTFGEGRSFTGEESFEINCHGSEVVVELILRLLCKEGARLAEPGEYSKRAFLNGKIDLSEAEAIMDVVNASTKQAASIAVQQLNGRVKEEINGIKEELSELLAAVEVFIDYPEEDLSLNIASWYGEVNRIIRMAERLIEGFVRGRYYREGISAAILGRTNAGKSTLFNYLLHEDKAIVSDIHGTTRDYLDGVINVAGYGVRIFDTAGLRRTDDPIEQEGTKRARSLADQTDLVIYVIAGDEGITPQDRDNLCSLDGSHKLLAVINKIDLLDDHGAELMKELDILLGGHFPMYHIVPMSAGGQLGLEQFTDQFLQLVTNAARVEGSDPVITNDRHAGLIDAGLESLKNSKARLAEEALDLAAFDMRDALDKFGEITGEVTPDDILDRIFSTFCVGK